MSNNNLAREKFEEGMADFVSHNYGRSVDLLSQAIELDPRFTLALKSRGAAYLKLDKVQEAIADMNTVIDIAPDNARAYHIRGLAHDKSGDLNKALEDFNQALELNPNYGAVFYSRASLHTKMGHTDEAAEDIRMVTQLSEVNIESFANENNVWRSRQLRLESMYNDDLAMER
ncbi:MAG: tetratricopeptide repeat protein [Desulfobacterales bacterium]|jgi:tetratricopeptide (TPR) repeat protein